MNLSILNNKFVSFHIMYFSLLLLCLINISVEQHKSDVDDSNATSLNLATSAISDIVGNISTVPIESKKSKVRKRPGAIPLPEQAIISESGDVSDPHNINHVMFKLKNSTVSPRKGAFNPPLVNDLSKLNNSSPVIDESEFSGSNLTVNSTEGISKINGTDRLPIHNSNTSDVESIKGSNATSVKSNDTMEMFSIITTTTPVPTPTFLESMNSSVVKANVSTQASIVKNDLDTNSSLTTVKNDLLNLNLSSKKPSTASAEGGSKKNNVWPIVGAILVVLTLCSFVGYVAYKRLYAYWDRRHYSRMDFLIDGLYEM